jgi:hypothetical protein
MSGQFVTVRIADAVAPNLALRDRADDFFDTIESRPEEKIEINFEGVDTISRSFAHEYYTRKTKSAKKVVEINQPDYVVKMLMRVRDSSKTTRFPELRNVPLIHL